MVCIAFIIHCECWLAGKTMHLDNFHRVVQWPICLLFREATARTNCTECACLAITVILSADILHIMAHYKRAL